MNQFLHNFLFLKDITGNMEKETMLSNNLQIENEAFKPGG